MLARFACFDGPDEATKGDADVPMAARTEVTANVEVFMLTCDGFARFVVV